MKKLLIKWGIDALQTLIVVSIKDEKALLRVQILVGLLIKVIEKLTDDDKDNTKQVKELFEQELEQVVTALKMMPVVEAVNIPFFTKYIDEQNKFNADEPIQHSAETMLTELLKWAEKLKLMRS